MPDERTAYFGDDGEYTALFMYVADKPRDLSAGTLYAAKFTQTSAENGGTGKLEWIKLGYAADKEIKRMIDKGIKFFIEANIRGKQLVHVTVLGKKDPLILPVKEVL